MLYFNMLIFMNFNGSAVDGDDRHFDSESTRQLKNKKWTQINAE